MNKRYAWKILAALLVILLFCGIAAAEIVYTTADFSKGTGELGVIREGKATPLAAGFPADVRVFSFSKEGKSLLAVREYEYDQSDGVYIYDPKTDWDPSIPNITWEKDAVECSNIYDIAVSGENLYAICNDSGNVVEIALSDYKPTGRSYAYPALDGFAAHGVKLLALNDGRIYALFILEKANYSTYNKSKLVELDRNLEYVTEFDVGENAMDMVNANNGNGIVVAYAGGYQRFGTTGGLDLVHTKADFAGKRVESLSNGKKLIEDQMITKVCYVDTHCLYFIGQSYEEDVGWPPVSTLYKWTGTMDAETPIEVVRDISSSQYSYQVVFDGNNGKIVTLAGDRILVFNLDNDEPKEEFDSFGLDGLQPYSMALVNSASGGSGNDDGGSSGCNAGLAAFAAFLLVLPLALRKKSR
jgi:Synergist-CTERM protein sorting domain-containing protein